MTNRKRKTRWINFNIDFAENVKFIAAMAHMLFSWAVVATFAYFQYNSLIVAGFVCILAAVKEFAIDANFEHNPPQKFKDNLIDTLEYVFGAVCAGVFFYFV